MKKVIFRLIDLYLAPLKWKSRVALLARNSFVVNLEHYYAFFDIASRLKSSEKKGILLDVGAFNGASTIIFAEQFPDKRIIAFEPNPDSFNQAVTKCAGYEQITVLPYALDEQKGEKDFYVTDNGLSSSLNPSHNNIFFKVKDKITVRAVTLDEAMEKEEKIFFIKIDAQGRELSILKGGTDTLKKTTFILTEMNNHHIYDNMCQYHEVDAFLRQHHFTLYNLTSGYNHNGVTEYDALYKNMDEGK